MNLGSVNIEWLNSNSMRSYPFRDDSALMPVVDGAVSEPRLPNSVVLDVSVATSSYDSAPDVFMSSFSLFGDMVTVSLSDASTGEVLATASTKLSDAGFSVARVNGVGTHDDIRGTIVFGEASDIGQFPDGSWSFPAEGALLDTRCVRPSVPCVSGIYVTDPVGSFESRRLRGDVALIAGENIKLRYDRADNAIVISAEPKTNYKEECECAYDDNRNEILSINGVSARDVTIEGDGDCVDVETRDGRIRITDKCSKPCCGCAELTFLNEKTNMLTTALGNLQGFSRDLDARLNDFIRNSMASLAGSVKYV